MGEYESLALNLTNLGARTLEVRVSGGSLIGAKTFPAERHLAFRRAVTVPTIRRERVADALPMISFLWSTVTSQDHGKSAPVHDCHAMLTNTLKHVRGGTTVFPNLAKYIVEMTTVVAGSDENRRKRPPINANICTIAPLAQDKHGIECALIYAEAGIPVSFMAMTTIFSTAPASPIPRRTADSHSAARIPLSGGSGLIM